MIIDFFHKMVIMQVQTRFGLDKSLRWRVLWESITKKGRLDETTIVDYQ